jgi:CheY-like chemotaxis protein
MADQLLANRKVLIVEDEMLVMMGIEDMLSDLGCTAISVASNVDTALDLIAANDFDFATIDVNLNGEQSYPVARALDQRGVPFAFSTGYGEHGVDEGFGDRPVLTKPFSNRQLLAAVTDLLTLADPPVTNSA